jgi:hypothetical protein
MSLADFDINSDGDDQGYEADALDVLSFRLRTNPPNGIRRWVLQVWSPDSFDSEEQIENNPPRSSPASPVLTLVGASSGQSVSPTTLTSAITATLPSSSGHCWIVRSIVNGGRDNAGHLDPSLIRERMIVVRDGLGNRDVVVTETTQQSNDGWADAFHQLRLTIDPNADPDIANVLTFGAGDPESTDDGPFIQAASDSGSLHVYIPAGDYPIGSAVDLSQAGQTIEFAPGANFIFGTSGSVTFSGARQVIKGGVGTIEDEFETSSTAFWSTGASTIIDQFTFHMNANAAECTLLKVSGARSRIYDYRLLGLGKVFKYALHAVAVAGTAVDSVALVGGDFDVGDSGVLATFGALIYWRGIRGRIYDIEFDGGGRAAFPDGVLIYDGGTNQLYNHKLFAATASYSIFRKDSSEFLTIVSGKCQGHNDGTYVANSEGISCGQFAGHLKMFDSIVSGWINGIVIHGSNDSPCFWGCSIVNNRDWAFVIDSVGSGGANGVRGITICGCYLADQLGTGMMWCKTGSGQGWLISSTQLGYQEIGLMIEDAFDANEGIAFIGNFIQGGMEGATAVAVCRPGVNTANQGISFYNNKYFAAGALATGPYASRAYDALDPPLAGVTIGTGGTRISKHFSVTASVNFSDALVANHYVDKSVTVAGLAIGDSIDVTVPDDVVYPGDMYTWWLAGANLVKIRRWNNGDWSSAAGTGTFRIDVWKH